MSRDDRTSVYLYRDGPTEVVQLDDERRAREGQKPIRSGMRPKRGGALGEGESPDVIDVTGTSAMPALAAQLVEELTMRAPGDVTPVIGRFVLHFDAAAPLLVERFPGPLWCDPRTATRRAPRGQAVSAIAACLVALADLAEPLVLALLRSHRSDQRFWATFVAREMPTPEIVQELFDLAVHADPRSRLGALMVIGELSHVESFDTQIARLRARLHRKSPQERLRAVQALEELRDAASVPALVDCLADDDVEVADAARSALRTITARTLGRLRWSLWLKTNRQRSRYEWLVDALEQWDEELSIIASVELARMTGHETVLERGASRADVLALVQRYRLRATDAKSRGTK